MRAVCVFVLPFFASSMAPERIKRIERGLGGPSTPVACWQPWAPGTWHAGSQVQEQLKFCSAHICACVVSYLLKVLRALSIIPFNNNNAVVVGSAASALVSSMQHPGSVPGA